MKTANVILILALFAVVSFSLIATTCSADSDNDAYTDVSTKEKFQESLENKIPKIRLTQDIDLDTDLTIPEGVTVLLPYSIDDQTGYLNGYYPDNNPKYTKISTEQAFIRLTVEKHLVVQGTLIIGGIIGNNQTFSYQGHTSSKYSEIQNNGTVTITSAGCLICYGFIKGDGELIAESGSSVTEPVVISDFVGADTMVLLYDSSQSPFNRYSLPNIRCDFTIHSEAILHGALCIYCRTAAGESPTFHTASITFIGEGCSLITLSDGATATFEYDPSKGIETKDNNQHRDIGKTTLTLSGGASFGAIELSILGYDLSFGNIAFPIPYNINIVLDDGSYLLSGMYRILPGSTITVGKNASLTLTGTISAYWGLDDVLFKNTRYPSTDSLRNSGFDISGRLVIEGTFFIMDNARFEGIAERNGGEAKIITSENIDKGVKTVTYGCNKSSSLIGSVNNISTREMAGYIVENGELVIIECSTIYCSDEDSTYTMEELSQSTGTTNLNSTFSGGWKKTTDPPLTTVNVELQDNILDINGLQKALDTEGVYSYYHLDITAAGENVSIDSEVITELQKCHSDFTLHMGKITLSIQYSTIITINKDLVVYAEEQGDINESQKNTIGDKLYYSLYLYSNNKELNVISGGMKISCEYTQKESSMDGLQIWCVDSAGRAVSGTATYADGKISFTAAASEIYAVSFEDVPTKNIKLGNTTQIILIGGLLVLLIAGLAAFGIYLKKKK